MRTAAANMIETLSTTVVGLGDAELTDRLRAIELEQRRLEAELALVVAEAERRQLHRNDRHRSLGSWLRSHTNWSGFQTTRRRRAARLVTTVPAAGAALHDGHIGIAQFDELARARANPRCGDRLVDHADRLLEWCEQLSYDEFCVCVRRWEALADEDGANRDRDASVEGRTAFVGPLGQGVVISASGGSPLEAEEMTAIFERFVDAEFCRDCDERTERHGPDAPTDLLPRTDGQRRFDALVNVFRSAGLADGSPVRRNPVVLDVISDEFSYLEALSRHGLALPPEPSPRHDLLDRRRETASGTPLLPDDLIAIALDEHVRGLVVNSAGVVIDYGRTHRLFSGPAREAALLTATRCSRNGCSLPARYCQVDHMDGWVGGGRTDQANAAPTCQHDNRAKHELGLVVRRTPEGYLNWYRRDGSYLGPVGRRRLPDEYEIERRIRERIAALRRPNPPG